MIPLNQSIHLVGSVPLSDSAEVFSTICDAFGNHLRRIPDGETGERGGWISFQHDMLEKHPAVILDSEGRTVPIRDLKGGISRENHLFVLNPAMAIEEIDFLPLGYVEAAIGSYAVFAEMQERGEISAETRFQVSIPTPFATGLLYFHPKSQHQYIALMMDALLNEMHQICEAIPHGKLAIQWDCCQEVLLAENYFPADWTYDVTTLSPALIKMGEAVPTDVDLGYHFCYGSPVDEPLVKQHDMQVVVTFTNALSRGLSRPLNFIHMPVSDPNADEQFFAPLADLTLSPESELYLGLINPRDPDGDQRRIAAARSHRSDFGIATECGWGRKNDQQLAPLLEEHISALA